MCSTFSTDPLEMNTTVQLFTLDTETDQSINHEH